MIDWNSDSVDVFLNARITDNLPKKCFQQLKSHLVIATSGSYCQKFVALSKEAMLTSAHAVNNHIQSDKSDIWIKCLPNHHVGGLSIYARSYLSGASVIECCGKWDPKAYTRFVDDEKGTLSSLVPTQVYDIVKEKLHCPPSLRAVFIGGGALSPLLYEEAKKLEWPLLVSYGLTECSSQVATSFPDSPDLYLLPHVEVKKNQEGSLFIKSQALLSGFFTFHENKLNWNDPKNDGWFQTEDQVDFVDNKIIILGRTDRTIKVSGELVNLTHLEAILEKICIEIGINIEVALLAIPDERLENLLCLAITNSYKQFAEEIRKKFLQSVLPYEQIRKVYFIHSIPKTSLGKIAMKQLLDFCRDHSGDSKA